MEYSYNSLTGYLGIALAVLGWGLANSLIGLGLADINPYLFLTLRFILAFILFSPFILLFKRKSFLDLITNKWIWIISFFEFLGLEFQYLGQQTVSAGLATLLAIQFIIFVPFLGAKFLNTPVTKTNIIAIIVAFSGTILIATDGKILNLFNTINIGVLFLLLSALFYSFYLISSSYFTNNVNKDVDSMTLFFIVTLGLSLFSVFPTAVTNNSFQVSDSIWILIVILAIFSTIIPFIGYFKGLKVVSANTMSLVLLLQIIVPFFIDIVFLGISYSSWIIIGSLLIVSSLVFFVSKPVIVKYQLEKKTQFNTSQVN